MLSPEFYNSMIMSDHDWRCRSSTKKGPQSFNSPCADEAGHGVSDETDRI